MSKVTVTADALGNVMTPTSNGNYSVRVESTTPVFKGKNLRFEKRSALIFGSKEELEAMGFEKGKELPGKIVVKESLTPLSKSDAEIGLKRAGTDGIVCTFQDQPIYRDTVYTPDENAQDELQPHDNGDVIRKAWEEVQKSKEVEEDEIV